MNTRRRGADLVQRVALLQLNSVSHEASVDVGSVGALLHLIINRRELFQRLEELGVDVGRKLGSGLRLFRPEREGHGLGVVTNGLHIQILRNYLIRGETLNILCREKQKLLRRQNNVSLGGSKRTLRYTFRTKVLQRRTKKYLRPKKRVEGPFMMWWIMRGSTSINMGFPIAPRVKTPGILINTITLVIIE